MQRLFAFYLLCILTGLSLLPCTASPLFAEEPARGEDVAEETEPSKIDNEKKATHDALEKKLSEATAYFTAIKNDKEQAAREENWETVIHQFQKLLDQNPTTGYAAASLFMLGRVRYSRYQQFRNSADLDQSLKDYQDVTALFPWHSLADDALLTSGRIQLEDKQNPQESARLYTRIITEYSTGDLHDNALEKLKFLAREHGTPLPPEPAAKTVDEGTENARSETDSAQETDAETGAAPASAAPEMTTETQASTIAALATELPNVKNRSFVLPVKYWSSKNYTRIVINTSREVSFREELLEKVGEQPRRLFIDFDKSYIEPRYRAPIPIKDGLLQQVRTAQFSPDTVRVVLDIESIESYKIYSLPDPFRVIVDVHGQGNGPVAADSEKKTVFTESKQKQKQKTIAVQGSEATTIVNETPLSAASAPAIEKTPESITEKAIETPPVKSTATPPPEPPKVAEASASEETITPEPPVLILQDYKKVTFSDQPKPPAPERNAPISSAAILSLAQQLNLGVRRIVLDPGHGGKDPGASAFGLHEKDIVLQVAQELAEQLKKELGCEVILTRNNDSFISLEERTAIANTNGADLFISLHLNAHSSTKIYGFETYYLNLSTDPEAIRVAALENATSTHQLSDLQGILSDIMKNSKIDESSRLAKQVQDALVDGLSNQKYQVKSLGVKQAPFYVLIGAEMPAILIEMAFISNKTDAMQMKKGRYQGAVAAEIVHGVQKYIRTITASR